MVMVMSATVVDALRDVLRGGNDIHRCAAAQALGRIGDAAARDALIEALRDEDVDVRVDAAEALGRLGDAAAVPALGESLVGDPAGDVKANAIAALARLGATEAAPVLRRLVRGRDEGIVWDEADFLEDGWDDWLDLQIAAITALGALGVAEAVPDIVAAIDDEEGQDLSEAALGALASLGETGIAALAALHARGDERLRRRCPRALRDVSSPIARSLLGRALADPTPEVRRVAVRTLAARDPGAVALGPLFDDQDAGVRAEVVRACGAHHRACLLARLDDDADAVQAAALEVLATLPPATIDDALLRRVRVKLFGPSVAVAEAATAALAALDPAAALADLAEQLGDRTCPIAVRRAAARALAKIGGGVAPLLMGVLGDDDRRLRVEALVGLARLAQSNATETTDATLAREALLGALAGELVPAPEPDEAPAVEPDTTPSAAKDEQAEDDPAKDEQAEDDQAEDETPPWPTSTLAAITGGDIPPPSAEAEPEIALDEADFEFLALARRMPRKRRVAPEAMIAAHEDVPRVAARVLGDVAGDDVALALARMLASGDKELRRIATDSLARVAAASKALPDEAIATLIAIAQDRDRDQRLAAARALGHAGGAEVPAAVERLAADSDPFVRAEALRALARLGAVGAVVEAALDDREPGVRLAAAQALARGGGPDTVARLVDFAFAHDGHHRREAARLLAGIDRDAAGALFLAVLADPKRLVAWHMAIEALEELYRAPPEATPPAPTQSRISA